MFVLSIVPGELHAWLWQEVLVCTWKIVIVCLRDQSLESMDKQAD